MAVTQVPFGSLTVGDTVLFGADRPDGTLWEWASDTIVKIDADGAHFGGGTYLTRSGSPIVLLSVEARA